LPIIRFLRSASIFVVKKEVEENRESYNIAEKPAKNTI